MRFIAILCSFMPLFSCFNSQHTQKTSETATLTYLALGDSYTIGQGVKEFERFPNQLQQKKYETIKSVNIIAQTGWTTGDLISYVKSINPEKHDIVSLLIGVNNQYQGRSFEEFKLEFNYLLDKSIALAKKQAFVVSIPDYGYTPYGASEKEIISKELDQYNAYMETVCKEKNIPFINITPISRSLGKEGVARDQLHPSGLQYSLWVDEILKSGIGI